MAGRIVPVAVTIAVSVNADGRREALGLDRHRLRPGGRRGGALLRDQSDESASQRSRYITPEAIGAVGDTATVSLSAVPA